MLQHVEVLEQAARDDRLLQLLRQHHSSRSNRIIIFVLYKKEAPRVESLLNRKGFNVGLWQKCRAVQQPPALSIMAEGAESMHCLLAYSGGAHL